MTIIDEILKQFGDIEYFSQAKSARFEKDGVTLILEYLGFGPAGGHTMRVVRCALESEVEIHFEKGALCWFPYYHRDWETDAEIFLYGYGGAGRALSVDMEAGYKLIQTAFFLELNLRAQGFALVPQENLYHPLFAGGVS